MDVPRSAIAVARRVVEYIATALSVRREVKMKKEWNCVEGCRCWMQWRPSVDDVSLELPLGLSRALLIGCIVQTFSSNTYFPYRAS